MSLTEHILIYILPLSLANLLHMWIVRKNYWGGLNRPLSTSMFGKNKGTRAFIVLPLGTAFFSLLIVSYLDLNLQYGLTMGFNLGLVYLLSELPNSFIKRRVGIPSGGQSISFPKLQKIADKTDSVVGTLLFYIWIIGGTWELALILLFIAFSFHYSLSYLLWKSGLKSNF